jgi:hypothetical protein
MSRVLFVAFDANRSVAPGLSMRWLRQRSGCTNGGGDSLNASCRRH